MLVDLVVLRLEGRKRSREQLAATPPMRVELTFSGGVATMTHAATPGVTLRNARLVKITADAFVIAGEQDYALPDRQVMTRPQSWWCRPIPPSGG